MGSPPGMRVISASVIIPPDSSDVCINVTMSLMIGFTIVLFHMTVVLPLL